MGRGRIQRGAGASERRRCRQGDLSAGQEREEEEPAVGLRQEDAARVLEGKVLHRAVRKCPAVSVRNIIKIKQLSS